jgi:hypothetical protein
MNYKYKVIDSKGNELGMFETKTMAELFTWALKVQFALAPFEESFSIAEIK